MPTHLPLYRGLIPLACFALGTAACTTPETTVKIPSRTQATLQAVGSCDALSQRIYDNSLAQYQAGLEATALALRSNPNPGVFDTPEAATDADTSSPVAASNDAGGTESSASREEGVDFSGTNNQESGVDEADFVKTDGNRLFVLDGDRFQIFSIAEAGSLVFESKATIEGRPFEMLIDGDEVVVLSHVSDPRPEDAPAKPERNFDFSVDAPSDGGVAESPPVPDSVAVEDSAVSAPSPVRSDLSIAYYGGGTSFIKASVFVLDATGLLNLAYGYYIEGNSLALRKIGSTVRLVTQKYLPTFEWHYGIYGGYSALASVDKSQQAHDVVIAGIMAELRKEIAPQPIAELAPRVYLQIGNAELTAQSLGNNDCAQYRVPEDGSGHSLASLWSFALQGAGLDANNAIPALDGDHILANRVTVYASTSTLVLAEPAARSWWYWFNQDTPDALNLHRFALDASGSAEYAGSGRVLGRLLDRYSISEYEDVIRVATTTGSRWDWDFVAQDEEDEPENTLVNHIYTLQGETQLEEIGHIGGIAEGEQIWSARFVGALGFLVTFEQTDPLWTIDLNDPYEPKILGELEVPGVSTYIHPIDNTERLLTIGYSGDENGLDWQIQVALFDVADLTLPSLSDAYSLAPPTPDQGWSGSWSEAASNPHAFQYWPPKRLLSVPVSSSRSFFETNNDGWRSYRYEYRSTLELLAVSNEGTLSGHGSISHSDYFARGNADYYWGSSDIRRSIFAGEFIYAISAAAITVHDVDSLERLAGYTLQGWDIESEEHTEGVPVAIPSDAGN